MIEGKTSAKKKTIVTKGMKVSALTDTLRD